MQLLLASTRPEVSEASCCHDTNLRSRASSRAIARYAGDSGIAKKESECKRGKMERESDGVAGDIMYIYAKTNVLD